MSPEPLLVSRGLAYEHVLGQDRWGPFIGTPAETHTVVGEHIPNEKEEFCN